MRLLQLDRVPAHVDRSNLVVSMSVGELMTLANSLFHVRPDDQEREAFVRLYRDIFQLNQICQYGLIDAWAIGFAHDLDNKIKEGKGDNNGQSIME